MHGYVDRIQYCDSERQSKLRDSTHTAFGSSFVASCGQLVVQMDDNTRNQGDLLDFSSLRLRVNTSES